MNKWYKKAFDTGKLSSRHCADEVDLDIFLNITLATGGTIEPDFKEKQQKRLDRKYQVLHGCPEYCLAVWEEE